MHLRIKMAVKTASITAGIGYAIGQTIQILSIKNDFLKSLPKRPSMILGISGCIGGCVGLLDYLLDDCIYYVQMYGGPRANSWLMARKWFLLQLSAREKNKLLELPYKEFAEKLYDSIDAELWENEFKRLQEHFHMARVKQEAIKIVKEHNQKIENQFKIPKA